MHRSKNFRQGGPGQSDPKKSSDVIFFFLVNRGYSQSTRTADELQLKITPSRSKVVSLCDA